MIQTLQENKKLRFVKSSIKKDAFIHPIRFFIEISPLLDIEILVGLFDI